VNGETVHIRRPAAQPCRSRTTTPRKCSPAKQFDPQRMLGNRAIARSAAATASGGSQWSPATVASATPPHTHATKGLLQRKCTCDEATGTSGACEGCSSTKMLGLQGKLKVNKPGDIYEQEADRNASAAPDRGHTDVSIIERIRSK